MSTEPVAEERIPPREEANIISMINYSYVNPLLALGWERSIEMSDLPPLAENDKAETQFNKVKTAWEGRKGTGSKGTRFWLTLYDAFTFEFFASGVFSVLESAVQIAQPLFLREILKWFEDSESNYERGIIFSLALVATSFSQVIIHHTLFYQTMRAGWAARMACISLIHNKCLRASSTARLDHTNGKIINMTSTDVLRFDQGFIFLHYLWIAFVDMVVIYFLMANSVGYGAAAAGLGVMLLVTAVQYTNTNLLASFRAGTAKATDARVSLATQVLSGMLSIKAACWEVPFSNKIAELRKAEASWILKSQFIKAFNLGMYFVAPILSSFVTFAVYTRNGNMLTVDVAYPTIGLIMVLRQSVGKKLAKGLELVPELHIGTQRIMEFLECEDDSGADEFQAPSDEDTVLEMDKVTARWPGAKDPSLHGISLKVRKGEMVMIAGPVGCGKSTILSTILSETQVLEGKVKVSTPVAYVPQQPWIMAGTVRDNILFGSDYDEARYNKIVKAACLSTDMKQLQNGDMTEIGERGVNLSGGQKARVSLARGLYSKASFIMLDDPLSAVDPHVCDAMIRSLRRLLETKEFGILLVTHQKKASNFSEMVATLTQDGRLSEVVVNDEIAEVKEEVAVEEEDKVEEKKEKLELVQAEDRMKGDVTLDTYTSYISGGGWVLWVIVLVMLMLGQAGMIMADYWLSVWASKSHDDQQKDHYIIVYGSFIGVAVVFGLVRVFLFFFFTTRASTAIHDNSFDAVVKTDMAFFTSNPLGRIINRFSSDLGQVDEMLPVSMFDTLQMACITLGTIVLICIAMVWVVIAIPFLIALFGFLRKYATTSLREIKRLDGMSRSPVFTSFAANLGGVTSIKAFKKQDSVQKKFQGTLERMAKPYYWWFCCNRWLGFRLDMMCFSLVMLLAGLAVALRGTVSASMYGLAMTYSLSLSGMFQFMVRQSSLVETFMTSVERMLYYTDNLQKEDGAEVPVTKPGWPRAGGVVLDHVSVKYREDLPVVLKDVTVSIESGKRVGVVGRTGSGKSSLFQALLRLNKVVGGCLQYDGEDLKMMPLHQMRLAVQLIPQEPVLFTGTVRYNLDPFMEKSDSEVWSALKAVTLDNEVKSLDHVVEENGSNFSTGHRQLFSLARAMLRASKIVLIDEATANVDSKTDELIQNIIRTSPAFQNATIITIAHRINTLIDSDLIMVLDNGELREYDTPAALQANPDSIFAGLVEASKRI